MYVVIMHVYTRLLNIHLNIHWNHDQIGSWKKGKQQQWNILIMLAVYYIPLKYLIITTRENDYKN